MICFFTSGDCSLAVELRELRAAAHDAQLPDRLGAQRLVLFALREREDAGLVVRRHVAADDRALDRRIRRRAVGVVENLPVLGAVHRAEEADRAQLEIRVRAALGDAADDLARPRRAALRQDEQRVLLHLDRAGARQQLLDHRQRAVGIALHQPAQREQLELFVVLRFGRHGLAGRLPQLDFERLRVLQPLAVLEALLEIGGRGQRLVALADLGEAVHLPVERRVGAGAVHREEPVQILERALVPAVLDRVARAVVQLIFFVVARVRERRHRREVRPIQREPRLLHRRRDHRARPASAASAASRGITGMTIGAIAGIGGIVGITNIGASSVPGASGRSPAAAASLDRPRRVRRRARRPPIAAPHTICFSMLMSFSWVARARFRARGVHREERGL